MSLEPGRTLGHYEIVEAIGAGGMGEVYRARDTKLRRDVAIKVLPDEFSKDKDRLDRFEREARLLAKLNHPNIATLYGLEESDGQKFLVMELVEGETLAEHIARGPILVDEALSLFIAIAAGLEAAHEKGIIHRDLKPANLKIGPDGKPKILDFGLASQAQERPWARSWERPLTMSPEQARGKTVDKRTDIWAFGCCLFETLTGTKPFAGDNVTDILASVVRAEPDWSRLPSDTPLHVRNVLRRCLKKKPDERLRDAGDARLLLGDEDVPVPVGGPRTSLSWAKVITFTLVAAALAGALIAWNVKREAPKAVMRFATVLPAAEDLGLPSRIALSPDGSKLAYGNRGGLYLRSLSHLEPRLIPDSSGRSAAFFSPDGEWIAFFDDMNLVKMRVDGDTTISLAKAGFGSSFLFTGTWGEDDSIVISEGYPGTLLRVHASTGDIEEATTLDTERGEISHYWPELLPGGKALLYTAVIMPSERRDIVGKLLDREESRLLIENGASPRYVRTGHIVFARDGVLFAVGFDAERLELTTEPFPFPVIEDDQRVW